MEVYSVQNTASSSLSNSTRKINGELGKNDFLNLLVTQLKYQDPLNPVEDKEFIAQMAQFTTLEQMYNLNSSISSMKAFSLIGSKVTAEIVDETTGEVKTVTGKVESVKISGSNTILVVNGKDVPIDKVSYVENSYQVSYGEYLLEQILTKLEQLQKRLADYTGGNNGKAEPEFAEAGEQLSPGNHEVNEV